MTICIAAIATHNDEEIIVLATDHMISITTIGQFERPIAKYKKINDNTIAMLSGNPLLFDEMLKDACDKKGLDNIKECIQKNMVTVSEQTIKQQILDIYHVDYDYIKEVLKGPLENPYIQNLMKTITEFSLKTGILLTGFIGSEAQIVEITENRMSDIRDINFDAIGSGQIQAMNTLLFQRHSMDDEIGTAIYNVYKAKRNAEVSVGVGKETDMLISTKKKSIILEEKHIEALSKIYEAELKYGKTNKKVLEIVGELI